LKVHEEFPEIQINGMLAIWCELQDMNFNELEGVSDNIIKICKNMYVIGRKANTQCNLKVNVDSDYCSKRKPIIIDLKLTNYLIKI
jgi:hypothetical protein